MTTRSVSVRVIANIREYSQSMRQMVKDTKSFKDELAETAAKGKGDLDAVANGAIAMGAALGAAVAGVIAKGADFEHSMAQVNAVAGATAAEFDAMREAAIEMGSSTSFSATEAANATEELAKAGLSAADITGGALAASLNLAAAGGIGLAESAAIAAKSMTQFELAASELNAVADTLAASANASNTDVTGLGESLKNVGTVANQVGFSIEETVGILSAFGDNALVGAEAGTNLRTTLLRLTAPTQEAANEMERLGIEVFDAEGNAKSATDIIGELEQGLRGLTQQERSAALAILFGQEAIAGANILLKEGSAGIGEYIEKVSEQGIAAETAGKRLDSLKGDVTLLNSALESMAIQSSGGATDGLRLLTQTATDMVGKINEIPTPVTNSAVVIGGMTAASLLLFGAMIKTRDATARMTEQLTNVGPAGRKAAVAINRLVTVGGSAVAAFAAIRTAVALLSNALSEDLNPQVDALALGVERWAESGKVSGEVARLFGDDLDDLGESLKAFNGYSEAAKGLDVFGVADDKLGKAEERIRSLDSALTQLQQTDPEVAAQAFTMIADEADRQGVSMEQLNDLFPEYFAAMETAGEMAGEAAEQTNPYISQLDILASMFDLAGESSEEAVKTMLDAWSEGATSFIDLVGAYSDGMAELEEDQELTTQGFIEQLRKQAEAQAEWADNLTSLAERGATGLVNELAAMGPEAAETVALMADMTDKELEEVIELWGLAGQQTGDELAAGILEGVESSEGGVTSLQNAIDSLEGKTITITTRQVNQIITQQFGMNAPQLHQRWGGVTLHAQTGLLRQAEVFGPVAPARFAFAEPATGGEAFIPKVGDRARSMAILSEAASWYGADVVPDGRFQWRGLEPVSINSPDAEPGPEGSGAGRRFGRVYVERQEVSVHAHNDVFGYQQTMDELAWHEVS